MIVKVFKFLNENNKLPPLDTPILELGCGDGRVLEPFYKSGYKVIGVDRDAESIKLAVASMPQGYFEIGDVRVFNLPDYYFFIIRNVLQFFDTKQEVEVLLQKLKDHHGFFTFFGPDDELAHKALTWTRVEVEKLCSSIGAQLIDEVNGMGTNLKGGPRRSHIFSCLK